jgi:class 3 adenylate cyclase
MISPDRSVAIVGASGEVVARRTPVEHSASARARIPGSRMQTRIGHVLVVDDDALNRRMVTATLARDGHRATAVTNGEEALDAIREDPPDVVLLDLEMPGIDGIEVLERIKRDEAFRHLPVIMISGVEDHDTVIRCLEMGADDFLPKPFDAAILRARINAGLDRKALHDLERDRVRGIFTRFLPEPLVDDVLARTDGDARITPELLTGTVLFGDLRGFTSFAERLPVDEVIEVLNTYLTLMSDAVLDHGGTLIDYMGDGIMAAFGAPVANERHADQAVDAARSMAGEQLAVFNAWLHGTDRDVSFRMGIGVNSGPVMSGSVGSPRRLDYAVIGDTTNTASRIESMTKDVEYPVLFSEQTKRSLDRVPDDAVHVGAHEVRGRNAKIDLWALDVREGGSA